MENISPEEQFLIVARLIKSRIETTAMREWWSAIEIPSITLEEHWREFRERYRQLFSVDREFPAFVVWTRERGVSVPYVVEQYDHFDEIPRDSQLIRSTGLLYSDPIVVQSEYTLLCSQDKGHPAKINDNDSEHRRRAIEILIAWIEAVQEFIDSSWSKNDPKSNGRGKANQSTKDQVGHVGHSKKTSDLPKNVPEDVQEVNRRLELKGNKNKDPIDVCREYIDEKHKNLNDSTKETYSQSLEKKRYRHRS